MKLPSKLKRWTYFKTTFVEYFIGIDNTNTLKHLTLRNLYAK